MNNSLHKLLLFLSSVVQAFNRSMSKVLERLIYMGIIYFLHLHVSKYQFEFMSKRSCSHKLLLFLPNIVQVFNSKPQLDVLLLNLQIAFDTISHNDLLLKSFMLGISSPLLEWFNIYLTSRVHKVSLNSCSSRMSSQWSPHSALSFH